VDAATGTIATIAGDGSQGFSGDGGPATQAQLSSLGGLATDKSGNLYIADNFNNRIRKVSLETGIIATVVGTGSRGYHGDGGPALAAELSNPLSVIVDPSGNLLIADSDNYRIRKVAASTGIITTIESGELFYGDTQHGFPCALALDAIGDLHIANSGISRIRRVPKNRLRETFFPLTNAFVLSLASPTGFRINATYDSSVPATAQAAFNDLIATYERAFTTNTTVNLNVTFGDTVLGQSLTQEQSVSYGAWRTAMIANANANPGNIFAAGAAASLPASDPIGNGNVLVNTANARALGLTANTAVDSTITFSNSITFEYNGVAASGEADFLDVAAHELNEALGISSALTGLADNSAIPQGDYSVEDYFRFSSAGTRGITTNPNAVVYFSYDGGNTNVAQFNQAYSAQGDSGLDRNDWIYGDYGCPASTMYVQNAITCLGQVVPVGSGPEITVLSALGYDSSVTQTITFGALGTVTFGAAPFTITATASSGLPVTFTSMTTNVCTVSASAVTIVAAGSCAITASQAGNVTYSAASSVTRSFAVNKAAQTIAFGAIGNAVFGLTPFPANATATSGLPVGFTSTTSVTCTMAGNSVTIVGAGTCSITASQSGNANYAAASPVVQSFTVSAGLAATGVSPAGGSAATQTFTFSFVDSIGFANISVVDVLINNYLDGQHGCYLALVPVNASSAYLYLVDDAGDGGYVSGSPLLLPSSGTLHNSQCTIDGSGSSISASGSSLTAALAVTFMAGFAGNKVVYMAARNNTQNSGWQAMGTWNIPGPSPAGPMVSGMNPARSTTMGQTYSFTFADTKGPSDLAVLDILTNSFLDGIGACYVAYVPTSATNGYLYLVDDAGDGGYAGGSPMRLSSGGILQNSQCSIITAGSSASASGNTSILSLQVAFASGFAGNRIFYAAARNNGAGNSGWQAIGSVTVP
jgi:hypothetical protein